MYHPMSVWGGGVGGYMKFCREKCEYMSWACVWIPLSGIKNTVHNCACRSVWPSQLLT